MAELRLSARVRAVIALRLARLRPHRDAVRLALGLLALPYGAVRATRAAAATIDAIWHAAGDPLDGFSGITKRATLGLAYASTLLVWLRDDSDDHAATLAFLDRRLAGIGRFTKCTRRFGNMFARRTSPA
jgi:ubiquinone biosynthesis protein COQ9